ncbi:uncharacterized protein LOC124643514 [Helicoverpa zea]|uniref:uncharacterized protein LOC124638917 n=1 Tax=Helicoverpa zea TaxID=7113 RepID=UPI001F56EE5B|nr:uncharacterized protein LOC124638917 [Helicoverpa zea]XP_047038471.1 uncharacterized protein LOC124643514 [Helicoverpa zea]
MMEHKQEVSEPTELAVVSVQSRLLPFWREYPRMWFIQFEAVVEPQKTSDENKYRYVLGQLQPTDLQHVTDIVIKPPETKKYEAIKQRLLSVYEQSEVKNFKNLISGLELGNQKPSQLLRRMRELGGNMITEDGIKIEWMNHLPPQMRVVLSVNTDSSLDMLAAMADKMMEYSESANIAAVSSSQPDSAAVNQKIMSAQIQVLSKQLENLTLEISELRSRGRPNHRRYQRSRSRSKSTARHQHDPNRVCYYHYRFGDQARRCVSPCARRNQKKSEN